MFREGDAGVAARPFERDRGGVEVEVGVGEVNDTRGRRRRNLDGVVALGQRDLGDRDLIVVPREDRVPPDGAVAPTGGGSATPRYPIFQP